MATSLRDTDSIVSSLEAFLAVVVHMIFVTFYLLVWGIDGEGPGLQLWRRSVGCRGDAWQRS
jgi:hypothetical protein